MKDRLQRFVRDNREDFDTEEPSEALWLKLSQKLPEGENNDVVHPAATADNTQVAIVHESFQNGRSYNPFFLSKPKGEGGAFDKATAQPVINDNSKNSRSNQWNWRVAASIALLIGLGWTGYSVYQNYDTTESSEMALSNPVFAQQVNQYTQLIDTKRAELSQMTKSNPALYQEFQGELEELERSYQNLKIDLPKNPNQEIVIQAMIQNLQWQIDLLNRQLDIIQRIKNKNNHANDKIA